MDEKPTKGQMIRAIVMAIIWLVASVTILLAALLSLHTVLLYEDIDQAIPALLYSFASGGWFALFVVYTVHYIGLKNKARSKGK